VEQLCESCLLKFDEIAPHLAVGEPEAPEQIGIGSSHRTAALHLCEQPLGPAAERLCGEREFLRMLGYLGRVRCESTSGEADEMPWCAVEVADQRLGNRGSQFTDVSAL
jgi:hypothetical protein